MNNLKELINITFTEIEDCKDLIQEKKNEASFLLKEWLAEFQQENNIKISLKVISVSYDDHDLIWNINPANPEVMKELIEMEALADKIGYDLKLMINH